MEEIYFNRAKPIWGGECATPIWTFLTLYFNIYLFIFSERRSVKERLGKITQRKI